MQVVIICGGLATRMHPLTEKMPKSMIEVNEKPLLWYQLQLLKKQGITDIILCVGHLSERIKDYFKEGKELGVNLTYSQEKELLGTAGAVKNINPDLIEDTFGVLYGDIISDLTFKDMLEFHNANNSAATILMRIKDKIGSSLINVKPDFQIIEFIERPSPEFLEGFLKQGKKNWVNSGIYVINKDVLDYIPENRKFDFAYDLFPLLLKQNKKLMGFPVKGFWKELGKIERIKEFEEEIKHSGLNTN
ncbi:NDP-sugar synthase [Candidatus Woesearchaeota archaeon]|nr:NDP-sugar synthase [Candidatus Woesearchaeota archaeon]